MDPVQHHRGGVQGTGPMSEAAQSALPHDVVMRSLRSMGDAFLACDSQGKVTYVNGEAETLLGPAPRLLGSTLWQTVPEAVAPGLRDLFRRAMAGTTPVEDEGRLETTGRWYRFRLLPVAEGLLAFLTDVTDRRTYHGYDAVGHSARVAQLTGALARAITSDEVVGTVVEHVLPPFDATGLIIQAVEEGGLRSVGCAGYPPVFTELVRKAPVTEMAEGTPVRDVLSAPYTLMFFPSPEELISAYPATADFVAIGGKNSWAFLPLVVSGRVIGFCCISWSRRRSLNENERTLLGALSALIAQALERARLYDAEYTRAQELQRGMLPHALPSVPAVTAAARFVPTSGDIGGDWYDVIPLTSGRVALAIGDVMGHGLSEAVTMGRLRTAVHTLAVLDLPPDELVVHLNNIVSGLGDDFCATFLYAVYDPVSGTCTFANAGHPPPAIVQPDGTVSFPELTINPPLGAGTPPFDTTELVLPPDSLVVMYTDGLVESRARDIGRGIADLTDILDEATGTAGWPPPGADHGEVAESLDQLCDTIVAGLLSSRQTCDDAALLITRVHRIPNRNVASWLLPDTAMAAAQAREHARSQLAAWNLDELVMTTELVVSELVGNVVRHAKGPVRLRLLRSDVLICEVSDGSLTTPHIRRASATDEGGRGLQLIEALSHRWGTRHAATGKCIWTEQLLPAG
ncbi:SpoIIE family protein phosphatase [Streptomyces sp. BE303]|uniref:SpoIIE family protein phosphatase n=1 Tax=Streptomyces sp. BE303 TaxID=3002528 RepID=UPI002E7A2042|nr:SpoIIE family protein phosphatase [Streptomyces sp. BE303]MED7952048.1 SpoIIE family protein phosphatase [Streptomyces sp. BE303]